MKVSIAENDGGFCRIKSDGEIVLVKIEIRGDGGGGGGGCRGASRGGCQVGHHCHHNHIVIIVISIINFSIVIIIIITIVIIIFCTRVAPAAPLPGHMQGPGIAVQVFTFSFNCLI